MWCLRSWWFGYVLIFISVTNFANKLIDWLAVVNRFSRRTSKLRLMWHTSEYDNLPVLLYLSCCRLTYQSPKLSIWTFISHNIMIWDNGNNVCLGASAWNFYANIVISFPITATNTVVALQWFIKLVSDSGHVICVYYLCKMLAHAQDRLFTCEIKMKLWLMWNPDSQVIR